MIRNTRRTRLVLEALEDRCTPTVFGNPWPDAAHLTLSFTPDKTPVGTWTSNLASVLNSQMPTSTWQMAVLKAWQTWAVNANINIGIVSDNGAALGTSGAPQGDERFGDIRLASYPLSSKALVVSCPFDPSLGTWSGDVKINANAPFGSDRGDYDLFTVLLQEAGHTLGMDNSDQFDSVMYEYYLGTRAGLSDDDVAGIQALYGARTPDAYENDGGATNNDSFANATPLSLLSLNNVLSLSSVLSASAEADLTTTADKDYYRFTVPLNVSALTVRVQTLGLSLVAPRLTIYNAAKQVVGTVASTNPNGGNLEFRLNGLSLLSTYYVKIESARSDVFGVGSYVLKVDSLPGVTGLVTTTGGVVEDTTALLNNDLHLNDSFLTASLVPQLFTSTSSRFDMAYQASISDSSDVDFYRIKAAKAATGTPNVMTVMAWGLKSGGLETKVTVYDAYQKIVAANVLVNDDVNYTIQIPNAVSGATYYVKVQAAQPQSSRGAGNYFLGIDFGTKAVEYAQFVAAGLSAKAPETSYVMETYQTQLHHLALAVDAGGSTVECAVRVTIYDANGNAVISKVAAAGDTITFDVILAPGSYTVRFAAGAKDKTKVLPTLKFNLAGIVGNDPIGPTPTDPTMQPSGSPPPSSGSTTTTASSDSSSTSSSSTSSSASTTSNSSPPTYTPTNKSYSTTDPYGTPYSPQ